MQRTVLTRTQYRRVLVMAFALSLALTAFRSAGADTSGVVAVTAEVGAPPQLSLTLCDPTADFGTGLTSDGAPAQGTTDQVFAVVDPTISPPWLNGVFYRWEPACQADNSGAFLTIQSNISWTLSTCATENTGTSSLRIANRDLRFGPVFTGYRDVNDLATAFLVCGGSGDPLPILSAGSGDFSSTRFFYYLQIEPTDTNGTFNSTTTWEVFA